MAEPIRQNSIDHDLSARFQSTQVVVASPQDNAETIIASLTLNGFGDVPVVSGVRLRGWAAFTVGTSGDGVNLKIRETNVSGTTVAATGLVTETAANLDEITVLGFDAAPGVKVYVLTMTVHAGAAASTVSAVHLAADVI